MRRKIGLVTLILISLNTQFAFATTYSEYNFAIEVKQKIGLAVNTDNKAWNAELARSYCSLRELLGQKPNKKKPTEVELENFKVEILNFAKPIEKLPYHEEGLNISVTCQMAYFVREGMIEKILPVSTGKSSTKSDLGKFKVFYKVKGWQESSLYPGAMMYKPIWYNGNEGVHGMESDKLVHSYPASHGCVRAKKQDMDWLVKNLQKGDTIKVYGKW